MNVTEALEARRLEACWRFFYLFRDIHIANRLADVAVQYWSGERRG